MTLNKKNKLLLGGLIILFIVSYKLSFSKTLSAIKDYGILKSEQSVAKELPNQLEALGQEKRYLDQQLAESKIGNSTIESSLLKTINKFANANNLKLISFLEPHRYHEGEIERTVFMFTLQGPYKDIEQLIYKLENEYSYGEIINLQFEKKNDPKRNKSFLSSQVMLIN